MKGDMSLVGPRPLLTEYLEHYDDQQIRRHEMRPGLTGLAQISGRNTQGVEERLALDVWYVHHWSGGWTARADHREDDLASCQGVWCHIPGPSDHVEIRRGMNG